jgi:hypothetical protein
VTTLRRVARAKANGHPYFTDLSAMQPLLTRFKTHGCTFLAPLRTDAKVVIGNERRRYLDGSSSRGFVDPGDKLKRLGGKAIHTGTGQMNAVRYRA